MTLEQLRIFVAVAEREHVTRAARDLNMTQSATSAAVAALESRYDTKLFDRVGRGIELTHGGRVFLAEAKAVLARSEAAELVLADLAGLKRGSLNVAASQTVGNYWLPPFMHDFQTRFPGISVTLAMGNTETVAARVRQGEANLGFVEGEVEEPTLSVVSVAEDELTLVAPTGHPWCGMKNGEVPDLRSGRWILREAGSGTRAILASMLQAAQISMKDIKIGLVLPTNEAVLSAVEAGAGVSVISKLVVASALKAGSVVAIDYPIAPRRFFMLRHRDRHVTAAEREFAQRMEPAAT
jgi:DNA-binding transcriptional LysR family regulator